MEFGFVYTRFDREPQLKRYIVFIALLLRREWISINSSIILTQITNSIMYMHKVFIVKTTYFFLLKVATIYFFANATTSQSPLYCLDQSGTIKIAQLRHGTGLQITTLPQKLPEGILKNICVHTHTHGHSNLSGFGLCKETHSSPQG